MFVIFNHETTHQLTTRTHRQGIMYKTVRGAEMALNRARTSGIHEDIDNYVITDVLEYREFLDSQDEIEVHNLMTGRPVMIKKDTPRSCDPSSELYWSM